LLRHGIKELHNGDCCTILSMLLANKGWRCALVGGEWHSRGSGALLASGSPPISLAVSCAAAWESPAHLQHQRCNGPPTGSSRCGWFAASMQRQDLA
jgi:hypothetical protein